VSGAPLDASDPQRATALKRKVHQLVRVAGIRNRLVHDYVALSGVEVHEAVRLLHGALPRYIAACQGWLRAGFPPAS
jgi:uncharacterized protein YutE (UPF0331/DUF86 family)